MQEVDLSALGAQAVAQVESARRQAAAQLTAAMQNKPKLALHAQLDGPKIAVPVPATQDGQGACPPIACCMLNVLAGMCLHGCMCPMWWLG